MLPDSEEHILTATPPDPWEEAYQRFETPEKEIQKFLRRLQEAGADKWPRDSEIAELFCGRGNGLHALERLGFSRLEGVDLSPRLLEQYRGAARCTVGDCRNLNFADESKDVVIVQGGLHHLPILPDDLEKTITQMHRVLRKNGRLVLVEPWLTPFLRLAHFACDRRALRRLSNKVDALATMIEFERQTYEAWLSQPDMIRRIVYARFAPIYQTFSRGKWIFVGRPV